MEITSRELAALTGGELIGDPNVVVKGFSKIEEAKTGDLSFISNPKYSHFLQTTKASILLVSQDFHDISGTDGPVLIKVADPYWALAMLLQHVESQKPKPSGIEQPVYISENVTIPDDIYLGAFTYLGKNIKIGEDVRIYPQCYIGDDVVIEEGSTIYAGVKIYNGTKIGKHCIIHSGCVLGSDGFGFAPKDGKYEKIPQTGIVEIKDYVEIGANTTIDRATFGKTVIGEGTKLDNLIQVAHNVTIGENNVVASQVGFAGSTHIGSGNRIGGQCGFAGHLKVGDNNEFGAQSGIPGNVGDNNRLIGYPAIDARQFAKNLVYIKRLGELFSKK